MIHWNRAPSTLTTLLDEAKAFIAAQPCRCTYLGEGDSIECSRCRWLAHYKEAPKADTPEVAITPAQTPAP